MSLIYYPNKQLLTRTQKVEDFSKVGEELDKMQTIMKEKDGLGLSHNQIGGNLSMFICVNHKDGKIIEFINPSIVDLSEEKVAMQEGCLSAPKVFLNISRPASVQIEFQDRLGDKKMILADNITGRCILHELEHLEGKFFFDNANRQQRKWAEKSLNKILGRK